jgi:predicted DsbA family dithiol-disulfide isomerase
VHVEIWSDIACPWCYVGKRRFEAALAGFEHRDEVQVTWRSFELDPSAPSERSGDGAQHLADKYGMSRDEALAAQQRLTDVAAGEGLSFRLDRARGGNTFDGHRVLHLAKAHGLQDAMKERIMRAYLEEGELISSHEVLSRLAAEVGLPDGEIRDVLASGRYADEVRDDERTAAGLGIRAVPFFVVDRKLGASGAQPAQALRDMLCQAWPAEPAVQVVAEGATCGPDGC